MKTDKFLLIFLIGIFSFDASIHSQKSAVTKIRDVIIYRDSTFYSSFPSVVKKPDGELIVAFRRAPDRRIFGEKGNSHVDPNSYLVQVRSKDALSWSREPELIYAHPFGGSQDPCLLQMNDGTLLCTSYGWAFVREDGISNLEKPYFDAGGAIFLGGYLVRSFDGGKSWTGPVYPPHMPSEIFINACGAPVPAYNRGALFEAKDGRILWIVAVSDSTAKTSNQLLTSEDKGITWKFGGIVASDPKISFNEASAYETPGGDILAFIRTAGFDDQACIARSHDRGRTFEWEPMGFKGHPVNALRLPDNRVLITYGYRHEPYGIRCRILNAECTDYKTAPEIILRDDGANSDIGYSWPVMTDSNHVLVTYYFNKDDGTRYIAGTIIEIR